MHAEIWRRVAICKRFCSCRWLPSTDQMPKWGSTKHETVLQFQRFLFRRFNGFSRCWVSVYLGISRGAWKHPRFYTITVYATLETNCRRRKSSQCCSKNRWCWSTTTDFRWRSLPIADIHDETSWRCCLAWW